jgi:hypothetical protein
MLAPASSSTAAASLAPRSPLPATRWRGLSLNLFLASSSAPFSMSIRIASNAAYREARCRGESPLGVVSLVSTRASANRMVSRGTSSFRQA